MNPEFVTILQKLISEQGKETLTNPGRFKAFIADYTHGEYKKESRLILHALEAGVQIAIDTAENLEICKKQQIKLLSDENFWKEDISASVFDTLLFIIKGIKKDKNCCKKCSKELPEEWKACPYCGTAVGSTTTLSSNTVKPQSIPKPSNKPSPSYTSFTPKIGKWTCSKCGDNNLETSILCKGCGRNKPSDAKIIPSILSHLIPSSQNSIGNKWTCKKCDEDNPSSSLSCKGCGEYR